MENPDQNIETTDSDSSDSKNDDCPFLEKQDTIKEKTDPPVEDVEDLSAAMHRADLAAGQGARPKEPRTMAVPSDDPAAGDEDEDEVMASSVICTDGSDVEALTDDRDLSDVDMQDTVRDAQLDSDEEVHSSWDSGLEKGPDDKTHSDSDAAVSSPHHAHVDAVVNVKNKPLQRSDSPSSLPLQGGEGARAKSFDRSDSESPPGGDEEVTPVAQGYDFMMDLDSMANGGILRPDSLSLPRPLQHRYRQKVARSESESSSWSDINSHHGSTEALLDGSSNTPLYTQGTVLKEGDQIAFVAEDLNEKIKRSSPLTKAGNLHLVVFL